MYCILRWFVVGYFQVHDIHSEPVPKQSRLRIGDAWAPHNYSLDLKDEERIRVEYHVRSMDEYT